MARTSPLQALQKCEVRRRSPVRVRSGPCLAPVVQWLRFSLAKAATRVQVPAGAFMIGESEILFLHIPKSASKPEIMFIPLGTIALANFLKQKGHPVKIVNVYVEKKLNNDFDVVEYAKKSNCKTICIPLHWHFQTTDVLDTAKRIKQAIPDSTIILGGFTATFFAEEIIENYDFVDFVIKGDSEIPLLDLAEGKETSEIPNLVWRKDNKTITNPQTYRLDEEMLNNLSFTDFSLISNFDEYQKLGLPETDKENKWLFVYNPGVGCNMNCSYCGGSCISQKRLNKREKAIFVDIEKAVKELKNLAKDSVGVWYVCFNPVQKMDYYVRLFRRLQQEKIRIRCKFEAWTLPSKEFVDEFKQTFVDGSEILISPDTGSEKVRKINKGFYYSNDEMLETLKHIDKNGITTRLYFTAGLPGETMKDFLETLQFINKIKKEFKNIAIHAVPIEIEPAAPLFMDKEKYGIRTGRKSIKDFYNIHKKRSDIGYSTEHFSADEIAELVNLVRAAGECMMKRPVFLKALAEGPFPIEKFPIKQAWRFCAICKFFNDCFA